MSSTILTFIFLLFAKHAICDLAIQRLFPSDKTKYFNKAAHLHYFHHAVGTWLAGLIIDVRFAFAIAIIDYLAHWHIDFSKSLIRVEFDLHNPDFKFWLLQSADQILHYLTYILLASYAITWL